MKKLELLREKRFVFLDGKISIQYHEMPQRKLSLRDLSELFLGNNEHFPNMHSHIAGSSYEMLFFEQPDDRADSPRQYEMFFYEPAGYEKLTFNQYYDLIHSDEVNKRLFSSPWPSTPFRATIRNTRKDDDVQMGLYLEVVDRKPSEVVLEWFVAAETEASAPMLHFLIASIYQNGMIYPITIERTADLE